MLTFPKQNVKIYKYNMYKIAISDIKFMHRQDMKCTLKDWIMRYV